MASNSNHFSMQTIYKRYHVVLAESLWNGQGYAFPEGRGAGGQTGPALFPIWGYALAAAPGVALGNPALFLGVLQSTLGIISIVCFYRMVGIREKIWHILLFIPYFFLLSVKWPDAIVGSLLIMYACSAHEYLRHNKMPHLFISGLLLGLAVNFRSEYLTLAAFQLILIFLPHLRAKRRRYALLVCVNLVIMLLALLPWAIRCRKVASDFRFTATNGGLVMYISLGQLKDNPWGIEHLDGAGFKYVADRGEKSPFSVEGERILKHAFYDAVRQHPWAYVRKVCRNFVRAVSNGTYVGDVVSPFADRQRSIEVTAHARSKGWWNTRYDFMTVRETLGQVRNTFVIKLRKIIPKVFIVLLVFFILSGLLSISKGHMMLFAVAAPLILQKFAVVSLLQCQPRHMSAIYMLLCGLALAEISREARMRVWLRLAWRKVLMFATSKFRCESLAKVVECDDREVGYSGEPDEQ